MINQIVNEIVQSLTDNLTFVDRITGIVKPATVSDADGNLKTFPVAVNLDPQTCTDSELLDYVPDSSKMSIIYFEDRGATVNGLNGEAIEFTANFLLVCWYSLLKIDHTITDSSAIAANVIKHLPLGNMGTIGNAMNIFLEVAGQEPNDGAVFSRYSYREEVNQYITYPYGYIALTLRADFRVRVDCIEDITLNPAICL